LPDRGTRAAFGRAFVIWLDRIKESRFPDTDKMFEQPDKFDVRVTAEGAPEYWANRITDLLQPSFDPIKPTALFVGRWQPFHDGHKALILEGLSRVGQVCIGLRNTYGSDGSNPFPFEVVRQRIEAALYAHTGRFTVVQLLNVTRICYGRDVGYTVETIDLDPDVEAISVSKTRRLLFDAGA